MKLYLLFLLALMLPLGAMAQEPLTAEPALELSLDECIGYALESNLNLRSSKLGMRVSELSITQAESRFDPTMSVSVQRDESTQPNYTTYIPVGSVESERTSLNMSIGQQLGYGGSWGAGLYNTLSESNVESEKNWSSNIGFNFNQPLMKNFGRDVARSSVYIAKLSRETTRYEIKRSVEMLCLRVVDTYYNLALARASLEVRELARDNADSLLAYNRRARELGLKTESDELEARSALLSREQAVIDQRTTIRQLEDQLLQYMNMADDVTPGSAVIPTDAPEVRTPALDTEQLHTTALDNRPDYLSAMSRREQDDLQLSLARKNLKPTLDLNASYRLRGSGTTVSENYKHLSQAEATGWVVGLEFRYPIGNRDAKAALEKRVVGVRQSEYELRDLENTIMNEIRNQVRSVETSREKLEVARLSVEVNELKLRKEEERFRNHLTTSYMVLQYQADLANAETSYQQALKDHVIAVYQLEHAKGTLLSDLGVGIIFEENDQR